MEFTLDIYKICKANVERRESGDENAKVFTWDDVATLLGFDSGKQLKDQYHTKKMKMEELIASGETGDELNVYKGTTQIRGDGSQMSDRLIMMSEEESKSPEFLLNAHGYDPKLWIVIEATNGFWNVPRKGDEESKTMMTSKIVVKPKKKDGLDWDDIEKYLLGLHLSKLEKFNTPQQINSSGQVLEVVLADIHVGNESLPFQILKNRIEFLASEIKRKAKGLKISRILVVQLGDILHMDNVNRQTTRGTQIFAGTDFYTAFDNATDLMIWFINEMLLIAPVKVINVYGNHDKSSSYGVAKVIEKAFQNNEDVEVDTSHDVVKYERVGKDVSLAFLHGDTPKNNTREVFSRGNRSLFGETLHSEIHAGHYHHEEAEDKAGAVVRYMPSITMPDEWHISKLYFGHRKGTQCFLWNLSGIQSDIWNIVY